MPKKSHADIDFRLQWKSSTAEHTDTYLIAGIDLENDIFPANLKEELANLKVGESCKHTIQAKDFLGEGYSSDKVITFDLSLFDSQFKNQFSPPILYRFYPNAIAWQGLGTHERDYSPFRLISKSNEEMVADCNHPLAKYYLTLTSTKLAQFEVNDSIPRKNIGKILTDKGPGMQAPFEFGDAVFFQQYPFRKAHSHSESQHLVKPVLNTTAQTQIAKLYTKLLPEYSKVLDLMSSSSSYLEQEYKTGLLAGIGANENALIKNDRLDTYLVQDLNSDFVLPFETNSFDNAICSLSIEYLFDPLAIIKEVARVVCSSGKFIITFSDNWLCNEAIVLWGQLHPFERIQLVLEFFRSTDLFDELHTFSSRRTQNSSVERSNSKHSLVNPVYAVWGTFK